MATAPRPASDVPTGPAPPGQPSSRSQLLAGRGAEAPAQPRPTRPPPPTTHRPTRAAADAARPDRALPTRNPAEPDPRAPVSTLHAAAHGWSGTPPGTTVPPAASAGTRSAPRPPRQAAGACP